jgi:predicted permease
MIAGMVARARSLWRGLTRRSAVEAEMHEEFRFHVEARVDDLVRAGLSRAEATRRASIEFGNFERYKDEARASRGLRLFDELKFSWLDVRLALRMLRRYPALTVIGGLAMAFGISAGVVGFEVITQLAHPRLPLPEGERIVGLQQWFVEESRAESPRVRDFVAWGDELESVADVAAFRTEGRNLIRDARAESIEVAEVSATAFVVARVPPLLGRWLIAADEALGAPPVVVIGHDVWQSRFGGDPGVVGQLVRLGSVPTTVVGVMPPGFAFPVAHDFWVPLDRARDAAAGLVVFGRLADGAAIEHAEAELETIIARVAPPSEERTLHARVIPFARAIFEPDVDFWIGIGFGNAFLLMLMVLACANVALLLFARAVTRELELALKSALGANRARLMMQFFAEALVLAALALAVGLGVARYGLQSFVALTEAVNGEARLPFWTHDTLSPTSILYAGALALLAAVIAGALPAFMVTRGDHRARLSHLTAAGAAATTSIGGVWSTLIVVQVAVTVLFPAAAFNFHRWASPAQTTEQSFDAGAYVSARLAVGDGVSGSAAPNLSIGEARDELARRLALQPAVLGVTFSSTPPGDQHEQAWFEVDGAGSPATSPVRSRASIASVAFDFFDVLDARVVGRAFLTVEQRSEANVVIVNQAFVDQVLGGRDAVGRSIRRAASRTGEAGAWYEVIGVAPLLGMAGHAGGPGVYFPLDPDERSPYVLAHLRGDTPPFASLIRNVALEVAPDLQLHEIMRLDERSESRSQSRYLSRLLVVISTLALLLSVMSIYAVVDFAVSKRTREIGVRVALGASPQSILAAIFRRPLIQIGAGIAVGAFLVVVTSSGMFGGLPTFGESLLIAAYVAIMWGVCMLACVVPTRRALRVHPVDALRAD